VAGLILLVIVGAWLAVLVPMALRSHDSATSLKSADRFGDAMRVLSRRSGRDVLIPRRPYDSLVVSETKSPRPAPVEPRESGRQLAARRRRRTLLVLAGVSWVTLVLAVMGVSWMLPMQIASDLLVVAFVVHLRKQARLRAQRRTAQRRPVHRPVPAAPAAPAAFTPPAPRVEGIPSRLPARPAPLAAPLPAPAARYEDKPLVANSATPVGGAPWSPVPVPPPMYVGKAAAPRRPPRVLDLTKPGEWTAALEGDEDLDLTAEGPELDDILDRRRTVSGW
jgi:hypothetical protein